VQQKHQEHYVQTGQLVIPTQAIRQLHVQPTSPFLAIARIGIAELIRIVMLIN